MIAAARPLLRARLRVTIASSGPATDFRGSTAGIAGAPGFRARKWAFPLGRREGTSVARLRAMLTGPAMTLLLAAAEPAQAVQPAGFDAARAELDACADRIEELKARQEMGRELERLLRRAQELAAALDRAAGDLPPAPAVPAPEELRERADAAHDEADRLAAEIASLDVRIQDARRMYRSESGGPVEGAALSTPAPFVGGERLRTLLAERGALARRRASAEAEAARLEAEARAAERVR